MKPNTFRSAAARATPAPEYGDDRVLSELGYAAGEIDALRRKKMI